MLNLFKRGFSLLLVVVLTFGMLQINVYAQENASTEEKVYSGATLEDEFAEDRVLIVLNNKASLAVDQYEADTFSEIDCRSVINLNQAKEMAVQEKLNSISMELEALATARNATELATTENVMKIAAEDEDLSSYHQVFCIELEESGKDKVLEAIAELEKRDDILYAGPDYKMTICATTANDTHYNDQWAINMIQLPQAWDITTGSSTVKVAVLDSGIDGNHPDLVGKIDTDLCRVFIGGNAFEEEMLTDNNGHGTFVAGIIGASADNGIGVTGTCWNVSLVSMRIASSDGKVSTSSAIAAIYCVEEMGIPIINYSSGWYDNYDYAMYTAIQDYSGLFVCSAGNKGKDNDTDDHYPSDYALPNIIAVGNSDEYDERNSDSNYGQTSVDLFAPGTGVYSTTPGGGYGKDSGTSFAAPYVAGVAALLLSKYPDMTTADLKQTILENVDIVYDEDDNNVYGAYCTSGGRLNAYKALSNRVCAHTYTYANQGINSGHRCTCSRCGYTCTENHTWVAILSMYQCSKCRVKSSFTPAMPESLGDENDEECCE